MVTVHWAFCRSPTRSTIPDCMELEMKPYTFYLHERRRDGPSYQFVACENDDHARTHARELFVSLPELIEI